MFDTIFKILYALFLFVAGIIISVRNNIFINRNNNNNHVILVEEDVVENERRTVINNNDNNNIIRHILNPNNDDTTIQITGDAVISQARYTQMSFPVLFSLIRNRLSNDNSPFFRISYTDNNENTAGFFMRENLRLCFNGQQDSITTLNRSNNIRPSLNFGSSIFRFELGTNIVEVNSFDVYRSATVNLMVTVNSEGIIGGLRAVGNNPKLNIGRDSILNIILDESSIINMRPDSAYPVISGFNRSYGSIRIVVREAIGIRSYRIGNNYYILLHSNNDNAIYSILNPNTNDETVDIESSGGSIIISRITDINSQIYTGTLSVLRQNFPQFNDNFPFFRVSYTDNNESTAGFFLRGNLRLCFNGILNTENRIILEDNVINYLNSNNIRPSMLFLNGSFRFELGTNIVGVSYFSLYQSATVNLVVAMNSEGIIGGIRGVGNRPGLEIRDNNTLNIELNKNTIDNMELNRVYPVIFGFEIPYYCRSRIRIREIIGTRSYYIGNDYYISRSNNDNVIYNILNFLNFIGRNNVNIGSDDNIVISRITDINSQIYTGTLSILRQNFPLLDDNSPFFRVSYMNNNENAVGFFLGEKTYINFSGQENRETRITFQDSIITSNQNNSNSRSHISFYNGLFRAVLGSNIVEVNKVDTCSSIVNLMVSINNEGQIGGLRAVGNNPRLNLERGGILNIILDESSIANMVEPYRHYPVLSGFSIPNYFRDGIRLVNNDRRLIGRFDENGNYFISLNTIYNILNPNNDEMPISIINDVTISQITNRYQILDIASFLLENNDSKPLDNQPIFRIIHNEERENNNRNITAFILRHETGINFIGRNSITLTNSIMVNGYIRFRDGSSRVVELGSNNMGANDFYIFDTVTFMITLNNEGLIGGLRGIGGTDSSLLRPTLYLTRDNSRLNIMLDDNSIANMMPGIAYNVISRLMIRPEHRDRIRLLNNVAGLIGYFDEDGNYVILNSRLSFTGWQLNSMSTQLQFVSNLNPEISDLSGSEGRYSMYYVNENTHNTNRLDYITSSDDDTEGEEEQDFAIQIERVRNFLRDYRRGNRYITTIIEAAINGTEEDNENTTSLAITVEDNRVEEVEDNNENNNENTHIHVRNNSNDTSHGHFDDLFTIFGDSVAVEEEEDDEDDEELNILPSQALNNNINIVPTPHNNNQPNNMGIGSTFGGGSGF